LSHHTYRTSFSAGTYRYTLSQLFSSFNCLKVLRLLQKLAPVLCLVQLKEKCD